MHLTYDWAQLKIEPGPVTPADHKCMSKWYLSTTNYLNKGYHTRVNNKVLSRRYFPSYLPMYISFKPRKCRIPQETGHSFVECCTRNVDYVILIGCPPARFCQVAV